MTTPENTTTTIDGKATSPENEGLPTTGTTAFEQSAGAEADGAADNGPGTSARLRAELDRVREQTLRDRADLENTRKRLQREKEEAVRYANGALLERLLPVLDNFELGLMAARNTTGASAVVAGMAMVQKQLDDFLREQGMQPIDAEGQKFDPNIHEALGEEASDEVPEGHVLRQQRKGYRLRERLVRPASVFVSTGKA